MITINTRRTALLGSALFLAATPFAAVAQTTNTTPEELPEVIVTATKLGSTALQKTPLAVSVFSEGALDRSVTNNIADLAQLTPSVNVGVVTASATIYIRGIGSNAVFNGSDPDVSVQVDGVYMARAFEQFTDFFDVDRVEVLRGPQGTIYGRNAVGGVVNIISNAPSDDFYAKEQVTVGEYGTFQNQAYISGPLIPGVLEGSLATNYETHDDYDKNVVPGQHGVSNANHGGVRVQLRWTPAPWVDATTRLDYSQLAEDLQSYDHLLKPVPYSAPLAASTIGNYFNVALNSPGELTETNQGFAEDVNFKLNDNLSLKSLTAYRLGRYLDNVDIDATESNVEFTTQQDTSKQFSQEFDLTGHYTDFDVTSGLYYFYEHETTTNIVEAPPSVLFPAARSLFLEITPDSRARSEAAFASGTYHLPYGFNLTLGARYTEDLKELNQDYTKRTLATFPVPGAQFPGFPFFAHVDPRYHSFTPKAGLDWQATNNALLYFTYTKGFKSGGNNYASGTATGITYAPEKITSYEVGAKTQWLDNRLRLNATAFDYDYTNLQVQSVLAPGLISINNAATATVRGLELEAIGKITPKLTVTANATYLDSKYDSFPAASVASALGPYLVGNPLYNAALTTYNAAGSKLDNAPKFAFTVDARYAQPFYDGEVYGNAEYHWQDRTYFDPTNAAPSSQAAYGLLNLAVGYNSPGNVWSAELVAKNALNKGYFLTLAANGLVPSGLSGPPRVVLLRVAYNF